MTDLQVLVDAWWRGRLGPRRGCGAVWLPVGGGRRRLVRDAAGRTGAHTGRPVSVLLVTRTEGIARLWRQGLAEMGDSNGLRVRVATPESLPTSVKVDLLVVDEPTRFPGQDLRRVSSIPHGHRLDLGLGEGGSDVGGDVDGIIEPRPLSSFDREIGQLVAGLLDGELERRQPLTELRWFRRQLGVPDLHTTVTRVSGLRRRLMAWRAGQLIERFPPTAISGSEEDADPQWATLDVADGTVEVPDSMRVAFPPGTVVSAPWGMSVEPARGDGYWFRIILPAKAAPTATGLMERLKTHGADSPYRGRVVEVIDVDGALDLRPAEPSTEDRSTLLLPDDIWREIDENITNIFANRELLVRLGLGLNRGLLLTGPPGTGKTHLTRVVAAELAGRATVTFVSTGAMTDHLTDVYDLAEELAPTLVVLEDIDLVVGDRSSRAGTARLNEFLNAVDGAMTAHDGIVTLATTNDLRTIDDAAKRAARFDRVVEVPLPPAAGRARIWRRYLAGLAGDFDIERLVRATAGGSGADIREIVRHAILSTNGRVTTDVLVQLASDRGLGRTQRVGQYL